MQKIFILSAVGTLLCVSGVQAQTVPAQAASTQAAPTQTVPTADEIQTAKPITLKLGAFFPSNGDVKDIFGSTFLSVGGEYAFVGKNRVSSVVPLVYVDYAGRSKNRSVSDGQGNSVSVDLTASTVGVGGGLRYYVGSPGTGSITPYLGAGVGLYFDHIKLAATTNSSGQSVSDSSSLNKTKLGFRLNAGVEFQKMYLVEVNYTNAGSIESTRLDGFGIQVGARF